MAAAIIVLVSSSALVRGLALGWGTSSAGILLASVLVLVGIVGLAAVTGLLNQIRVRVADGRVVGHLLPVRVFAIPVDTITGLQPTNISAAEAGGIGYRLMPAARYLLFNAGPAVRVETRRGRNYFIRSDRPDQMIDAIEASRTHID